MSVPPWARLLSVPEAGRCGDDEIGQHRYQAALGIFGTAPALDRE
jgi:hypothetical protein